MTAGTRLPDFSVLTEPQLSFHPLDPAKRSIQPLRGLLEHGPYTAAIPRGVREGQWRAPDLVKRDFPAAKINQKWYGDGKLLAWPVTISVIGSIRPSLTRLKA